MNRSPGCKAYDLQLSFLSIGQEVDSIAVAQNASVSNVRRQHSSEIAGSPERPHHRSCLQKEETSPDSAGHSWSGMLSKPRCSDELANQTRSLTARYFQKLKIGSCKDSRFRYYIFLRLGPPRCDCWNGRLAQGESASLTRKRSQVQIL